MKATAPPKQYFYLKEKPTKIRLLYFGSSKKVDLSQGYGYKYFNRMLPKKAWGSEIKVSSNSLTFFSLEMRSIYSQTL